MVENRMWFNEANDSHYFLVPGLIVHGDDADRRLSHHHGDGAGVGTRHLEALFVTPVRVDEILLGKTLPYFAMGLIGLTLCFLAARIPVPRAVPRFLAGAGRRLGALSAHRARASAS